MNQVLKYALAILTGIGITAGALTFELIPYLLETSFFPNANPLLSRVLRRVSEILISTTFYYFLNKRKPALTTWEGKTILYVVLGSAALFTISSLMQSIWDYYFMDPILAEVIGANPNTRIFGLLITVGILGPIYEEIVFRGLILRLLKRITLNRYFAIIFSSLLFGIVHLNWFAPFSAFFSVISAFIFGLVVAAIWEKTENIYLCILFHMTYNFLAILF